MPVFLPFLLPLLFIAAQYAVIGGIPTVAAPAAYLAMVLGPLGAAAACLWRARREAPSARSAWQAVALSLAIWSLGAFGNLWQEWVLGRVGEMYRSAMLAFNLAAVPIAFVLASDWHATGRRWVRVIDGLVASALGYAFFLAVWSLLTGAADEAGVITLVWLLDAQNLFLLAGAAVRWYAATEAPERGLFRALSAYLAVYLALIFWNNHFVAGDAASGPVGSAVITIAFAVCAAMALRLPRADRAPMWRPDPQVARAVRIASPALLAGALLIVSLFMIRVDYARGTAGILAAVVGYAARTTLIQMRHMARRDLLRRERSALQTIAWTDALTGVANRRFLDHVLSQAARRSARVGQPMSALMIDIDHFKQFNDRLGHPAGDACLQRVAEVLQHTLVRPGDVLARYGGEEFIALLHDADIDGASVVAERLRAAVQALAIPHADSPFGVVTVSIGAASVVQADAAAANGMVESADKALYEAKRQGRNRVAR